MLVIALTLLLFAAAAAIAVLLLKLQQKSFNAQNFYRDRAEIEAEKQEIEIALAANAGKREALRQRRNAAEAELLAAQRQCGLDRSLAGEDFTDWLRRLEIAAAADAEYQQLLAGQQDIFRQAEELRAALQAANESVPFYSGDSRDIAALIEAAEIKRAEWVAQKQDIKIAAERAAEAEAEKETRARQKAQTEAEYESAQATWQAELQAAFGGKLANLTEENIAVLTELQSLKFGAEKIQRDLAALSSEKAQQKRQFAELPQGKAALEAALALAETDLADIENKYRAAVEIRSRKEQELQKLTGSDEIAELEQRQQNLALEIEDKARHYLRLSFGLKLAEAAISRYHDTHREAMINATERAFSALTNGAYQQLKTQKEGNREILLAVDKDNIVRRTENMSKGTRFQLYMALRAAAYEQLLAQNINLPFFCDDIFETFDEERTRSACRLMQYIGNQGQAVYFTHHRHVADIARETCGDNVIIHEID